MAQLGDFGLAEEASSDQQFQSTAEVGTPYYTAPEMIQNEPYSYAADNWSLGVVLYELLFLRFFWVRFGSRTLMGRLRPPCTGFKRLRMSIPSAT